MTDEHVAEATLEVTEKIEEGEEGEEEKVVGGRGITTLAEALKGKSNLEASIHNLWCLLFYLRACPKLGADLEVLPRPMGTRSVVESQNRKWHNVVMQRIARMDSVQKMPAVRQSRQAAWIAHTESTRKKIAPALPASLEMNRGHVQCAMVGSKWEVVLVIAVYRHYQSRSGSSQLVVHSLPYGSLNCVRVVRNLSGLMV